MTGPKITPAAGKKFAMGDVLMELVFSPDFQRRWQGQYDQAQEGVDTEVLDRSQPFIPYRTGQLIDSGVQGTTIGSGLVQWTAPYARPVYYRPRNSGIGFRGPFWFERMKQLFGRLIIANARRNAGGGK